MTDNLLSFSRKQFFGFVAVLLLSVALTFGAGLLQQEAPGAPESKGPVWLDAAGNPLPFQGHKEICEFLSTANVVSMKGTPVGVTAPRKVLLEKDGIQVHAAFRDVRIEKPRMDLADGTEFNFRDDCIFECAAYELALMLGLDNVPPTVERRIRGQKGTLQIWVEKAMMELNRQKEKISPPNVLRWNRQNYVMHVFDNLIYNKDRNQGNILIDGNWKLWMIDHTRAFRTYDDLLKADQLKQCERSLWTRLVSLDEEEVKTRLKSYLKSYEINGLLKRRQKLIDHFQKLIAEKGEAAILYTLDPTEALH